MSKEKPSFRAVGYTRLSQESDTSIESQKYDIRDYCNKNKLDLKKVFDDGQNTSGYNNERTQYQEMKKRLETGLVDAVVVRDRQRLGRDFAERMRFILDLRDLDVDLHTTLEGEIDLDDPFSVAVEGIHSASDDKKKRMEIQKAKSEIKKRVDLGYYQGRTPTGLQLDDERKFLEPGKDYFKCLKVLVMRYQGFSYPDIEEEIDSIHQSTAYRICEKSEVYFGFLDRFIR